jgi:hypothetical protein
MFSETAFHRTGSFTGGSNTVPTSISKYQAKSKNWIRRPKDIEKDRASAQPSGKI